MVRHAEIQADKEEAAQERRHGREINLDDKDWWRPKCHRCGMNLKEIPKIFAREYAGKLFFCEKETCPEFEKKVKVE